MKEDTREELFERYTETYYSQVNRFDRRSYEKSAQAYSYLYDRFLPKDLDAQILDIGCGTGFFLLYLKNRGYKQFYGIDLSEQQLALCREYVTDQVACEDAFDFLRSHKEMFNLIIINDFIEHVEKRRIISLLGLVRDALKEKGRLILKTPNMGFPMGQRCRYIDFTHEVCFTEESIWQVLKHCRFRDINIYSTDYSIKWEQKLRMKIRAAIVNFIFGKCLNVGLPRIRSANLLVVADK